MSEEIEELVREALVTEADLARPVPDLAPRARGRLRRRRRVRATIGGLATVVVLSTVVVVGVTNRSHTPPQPPAATRPAAEVSSTIQLKPLLVQGHLSEPVQLGGGALRLDPPTRAPGMSESGAVRVWAAAVAGAQVMTGDTVVFLTDATVHVPIARPQVPDLSAWATPQVEHRTVWAIATGNDVPEMCPNIRVTASPAPVTGPQPQIETVTLIAADGSGEGVTYSTGTPICAFPQRPPSAQVAFYVVTLPAGTAFSTPPCGSADSSYTAYDKSGITTNVTGIDVWMIGLRCEGSMSVPSLLRRPASSPQGGLEPGRQSETLLSGVQYFDGHVHAFP
jgi:hypothetical protein